MFRGFHRFLDKARREKKGVTAIEYGLIAALIAVAIIATVKLVGTELNSTFSTVQTELNTANN